MTDTKQSVLALFDFDGTITKQDSFIEFLKFTQGKLKLYAGFTLLGPWLLGYFKGFISGHRMKTLVMSLFFRNKKEPEFIELCNRYVDTLLDDFVKASAMERIQWHKEQCHRIIVVSASFTHWIEPWCDKHELELIATHLEVKDNRLTGKLATPNCIGPEKARRIKEIVNLRDYTIIYAYGNSSGDKEMLELAHEKFYCNFK